MNFMLAAADLSREYLRTEIGFGFLSAVISIHNQAVFFWAFRTSHDTIGVLAGGQSSPTDDSGDPK